MSLNSPSTVFNNLSEILAELDSSTDYHKKPGVLKASNKIIASSLLLLDAFEATNSIAEATPTNEDYTVLSNLQELEVDLTKILETNDILVNDLQTEIQDKATTLFVEHDFSSKCLSACSMKCTENTKCLMCMDAEIYISLTYRLSRKTTRLRRKGHTISRITFGMPSEYRKTSYYKFYRNKKSKFVENSRSRRKINKNK